MRVAYIYIRRGRGMVARPPPPMRYTYIYLVRKVSVRYSLLGNLEGFFAGVSMGPGWHIVLCSIMIGDCDRVFEDLVA